MDATRAERKSNLNAGNHQENGGLANLGFSAWDHCQGHKQDGERTTHNNSLEKCTHITNPCPFSDWSFVSHPRTAAPLPRYKVERQLARLQSFHRLVVRYVYHLENF